MQSMQNDFSSNRRGSKKAGERRRKKGSPVIEERAKAQRAKLNAQAEVRQAEEEKEAAARKTQSRKTIRQDLQTKRRVLETLIEAYIRTILVAIIARKHWSGIGQLWD